MRTFYSYIFYKLYKFTQKYGDYDDPEYSAMLILSILVDFNLLGILAIIIHFEPPWLDKVEMNQKIIAIFVFSIITFFNHSLFIRKARYKKIRLKFDEENIPSYYSIAYWAYIVGSCVFLFGSFFFI